MLLYNIGLTTRAAINGFFYPMTLLALFDILLMGIGDNGRYLYGVRLLLPLLLPYRLLYYYRYTTFPLFIAPFLL